jgi:hypothetical protein
MVQYIIRCVVICVTLITMWLGVCVVARKIGKIEHFNTGAEPDSATTATDTPFYSPITIAHTSGGRCKPVPVTNGVCNSYNASNTTSTHFAKPVRIDNMYLCKTGNCVFGQENNTTNYNKVFSTMSDRFTNGFSDLLTADLLAPPNESQSTNPSDTLQGQVHKLKDTGVRLQTAQAKYADTLTTMNTIGKSLWGDVCMNTPYDVLDEEQLEQIFTTDGQKGLSKNTIICGQLNRLFSPVRTTGQFVVRAMRGEKASGKQYGFIEVVPYANLVVDNLVWTDRQERFVSFPNGDGTTVHPKGQFVEEETRYIRSANSDKETSSGDVQMILWSNKPVTVFIELWQQAKKKLGVNDWCNASYGWTKLNRPLAQWHTPTRTAAYFATLASGALFQQGVYSKSFKAGATIHLNGNGGRHSGSYYVFVSSAPFKNPGEMDGLLG